MNENENTTPKTSELKDTQLNKVSGGMFTGRGNGFYINKELCNACEWCVPHCCKGAIHISYYNSYIDESCIECGLCAESCPNGAIFPG